MLHDELWLFGQVCATMLRLGMRTRSIFNAQHFATPLNRLAKCAQNVATNNDCNVTSPVRRTNIHVLFTLLLAVGSDISILRAPMAAAFIPFMSPLKSPTLFEYCVCSLTLSPPRGLPLTSKIVWR